MTALKHPPTGEVNPETGLPKRTRFIATSPREQLLADSLKWALGLLSEVVDPVLDPIIHSPRRGKDWTRDVYKLLGIQ